MSLHVGEEVGDYRIVSIIGAGAMGQVFQVEHRITKRREAVKVLQAELARGTQIQRFQREIEVQARLDHPNIATVHNALHLDDCLVLVMEFVEGQTLERLLKTNRVPLPTGIDYIRQTLSALHYAHERGVVHRDVTPANLIITPSGRVKLTDFGVAKSLGDWRLTNGGEIVGSLYYMSPEQVRGHGEPDARSDIYSTGAVLYEIVTGRKPFEQDNRLSLMVAQAEKEPQRPIDLEPGIAPELNDIILTALAKDPGQRYQSAAEFLRAIEHFEEARVQCTLPRHGFLSRARVGIAALAAFSLGGIGGLGRSSFHRPKPPVLSRAPAPIAKTAATLPCTTITARPASNPAKVKVQPGPHQAALHPAAEVPKVVSEEFVGLQAPAPEPKKKRFWSKLNPFKKKRVDPGEAKLQP